MGEHTEEDDPGTARVSPTASRLLAATLFCENCGEATPHRILRIVTAGKSPAGDLRGVARCRSCRWTHPFEVVRAGGVEVNEIVSEGSRSDRRRVTLPKGQRVQLGSGVPGSPEPLRIHRIETRDGTSPSDALTDAVATLWVTRDVGSVVPVSVVEGARTVPRRLTVPPETLFRVGEEIAVDGRTIVIVALRARGHTWRRLGDEFPGSEVRRIYGRRTEIPPAGRRDWTRGRGTPSSRESSISRSERSRSAPGVRRNRTVPRVRTAVGGATVHRDSPS